MLKEITLGVDLHGVIDKNPELFKYLAKILRDKGVKIFVISGPPKDQVLEELSQMHVLQGEHFDEAYTIVDFLQGCPNIKMWQDANGDWWTSEENWWSSKAKICEKYNVTVMIDDTYKYKPYFENCTSKFILFKKTGSKEKYNAKNKS